MKVRRTVHNGISKHEGLLLPANEVWDKVIFLHLFVIMFTRGVCLSACWETPLLGRPPCQGDPPLPGRPPTKETPLPRRPLPGRPPTCQGDPPPRRPPAKEAPLARETPCQGGPPLQAHTQGEIEGDQVQAHTQGGN